MKVQVSLDDRLMERIDYYAKENYMSRSGMISIACTQYLNQYEAVNAVINMSVCMKKIADRGMVDEETMKELEDIERLCKMLKM